MNTRELNIYLNVEGPEVGEVAKVSPAWGISKGLRSLVV
jgi:hypothetical protein